MNKLLILIVAILLAAAKITSGNDSNSSLLPEPSLKIPRALVPQRPRLSSRSYSSSNAKGRLLTPQDGCGLASMPQTRVIGGQSPQSGALPFMALLVYWYYGRIASFDCGGSLITSRHVLSAAHCMKPQLYLVRLGEHDKRTTRDGAHIDVSVARYEKHARYNARNLINDIAIVYLDRDVEFTDRVRPICLPFSNQILNRKFTGSYAIAAGWGFTDIKNAERSPILLRVQVPILNSADCVKLYGSAGDRVICAGYYNKKGVAQGDSGGPLMLPLNELGIPGTSMRSPYYQIGIVSGGRPYQPTYYTSVQYFANG